MTVLVVVGWFLVVLVAMYLAACLKAYVAPGHHPNEPPHIYEWPIIGQFPKVLSYGERQLELNQDSHEMLGDTFSWQLFHIKGASTCDPEVIRHITATHFTNYVKGDIMLHLLEPFLGQGIFAVNGKEWKHQRSAARPLFRQSSLQQMVPTFTREGELFLKKLQEAQDNKTVIDLQNYFMRYTLDSFSEIGFGHNVGSLERPVTFSSWFDYVQSEIEKRGNNPLREYFIFRKFNEGIKHLDEFVYSIIAMRRKDPIEMLEKNTDLLSRFLCTVDEETGKPFSDKYLRDILMNFVIAGRDTTALLLTWTFYLLASHPYAEEKVLKEIDATLEGEQPSWEKVKNMPYLKAVLDETLRLYPPVPMNVKRAVEDDIIPGGFFIKKGTEVQFNAYTVHRSTKLWGPDANEFKPERWLEEGFMKKIHPYQYFPFHAGPRMCLGMKMAFLEAKLLASMILQKHRVLLVPGRTVTFSKSITLPVKDGLHVTIVPRASTDSV